LASLDRLANRQRLLEQNNGLGQADASKNGGSTKTDSNVINGGGYAVGVRISSPYQFKLCCVLLMLNYVLRLLG
jgi:hypothetical protein